MAVFFGLSIRHNIPQNTLATSQACWQPMFSDRGSMAYLTGSARPEEKCAYVKRYMRPLVFKRCSLK